jgi:hypothetical protein
MNSDSITSEEIVYFGVAETVTREYFERFVQQPFRQPNSDEPVYLRDDYKFVEVLSENGSIYKLRCDMSGLELDIERFDEYINHFYSGNKHFNDENYWELEYCFHPEAYAVTKNARSI